MQDNPEHDATGDGGTPRKDPPTQWERRPAGESGLRDQLQGSEPVYEGSDTAQRPADDQMSLASTLKGGGRDLGGSADSAEPKLCPACGAVVTFVQGKCSNCGHKEGEAVHAPPVPSTSIGGVDSSQLGRFALIAVVVAVIIIIAIVAIPQIQKSVQESARRSTEERLAETEPFTPVPVNEAFMERLERSLLTCNEDWVDAETDCHIYRYRCNDKIEPDSQYIRVTAYLGGAEAEDVKTKAEAGELTNPLTKFLSELDQKTGVTTYITYKVTDGEESPGIDDKYIAYGYYYGREHWGNTQEILDVLEAIKDADGQYPRTIYSNMVTPNIKTEGGFVFVSDGFGYMPIYKTDAKGNIVMGSGSARASMTPEAATGYILVMYTKSPNEGIDMYSKEDLRYYQEKITPFPYPAAEKVHNMEFNPDGQPDGIAAVIISGELQK